MDQDKRPFEIRRSVAVVGSTASGKSALASAIAKAYSGEITSGALETSKTDLATEFSNMIVTQRAYSAATKIITTADEMLDELTRMT